MKDYLKNHFVEAFTVMAWVSLLGFIIYCKVAGIETDSERDAWNILLIISGYIWGSAAKASRTKPGEPGTTTAEVSATIKTETKPENNE